MFDPMALLALPFEEGAIPTPARADGAPAPVPCLRARPSPALRPELFACEQGAKPDHDALAAQGAEVTARFDPEPTGAPAAAVALTRSKAENRANIARAWAMVAPGGYVLLAGAKTDGVESLQKELRKLVDLAGVEPRNHGRVIWMQRGEDTPAPFAAWIAEAARAPRVEEAGRAWTTEAGLFSWTEPDPGSQLLAPWIGGLSGRVADLGAGWGYLAPAVLASEKVAALDLHEAEAAGLDCARAALDDPRVSFHWTDVAAPGALPARTYDHVVSNPPFHAGRNVALHLGEAFLAAAAAALKPSGTFWMVANQQLPYERELEARFGIVETLERTTRYKVFKARKPRKS
ncbi:class I SAM-dependent methyltransferase [Rhodovulum sp. DZ06]|uniref:class I SAM-dependent methyltransferase n=1 Tax=Rhodovulum sp. DZ06 TaxID=3425126 RepID=UPI003D332EC0